MLGNTLAITVGGTPYTLIKINQDSYASEYLCRESDEELTARIRHSKVSRGGVTYDRHNFELSHKIYATPTTDEVNRKVYYVFEQSSKDLSIALPSAAFTLALASTAALLTSLSNWES